jgi:hypothetical protein
MLLAASFVVFAILHRLAPLGSLYLFLWDLFHQVLFYIGGVLAFAEMVMLKWLATPLEKKVFTGLAVACLFIASFQAWIDEHHNVEVLITEKSHAIEEREFWKGQSYAKDQSVRDRDALLDHNIGALSDTQSALANLSNKILDIARPQPAIPQMRIASFPTNTKVKGADLMVWLLIVLINRDVSPLRGTVTCDKPLNLQAGRIFMPGDVATMSVGPYPIGDRSYRIQYTDPAVWKPDTPLVFEVVQVEHPEGCKFTLD